MHHDCRFTHGFVGPIYLMSPQTLGQIWLPSVFVENQRVYEDYDMPTVECLVYNNGLIECVNVFLGAFFSKYVPRPPISPWFNDSPT